jgi:membrane protein required for colicin V production
VILDLASLLALLLAAASGAFTGALRQLAKLGAAGLALAGTRALAPSVADALTRSVPRVVAGPLASAATFAALYVVLAIGLGLLSRAARAAGAVPAPLDRGAGALLGGAKAALVVWVLLSALVAWGRPLPFLGAALQEPTSDLAALARERSAFGPRRAAPASRAASSPPASASSREEREGDEERSERARRARREAAAAEWGAGAGAAR